MLFFQLPKNFKGEGRSNRYKHCIIHSYCEDHQKLLGGTKENENCELKIKKILMLVIDVMQAAILWLLVEMLKCWCPYFSGD